MSNFFELKHLTNEQEEKLIQEVAAGFIFMHQFQFERKSEHMDLFLKNPISGSVTFFGGSFHPFHRGHLECLLQCPEKNIVVILDRNPLKELREIDRLSELQKIVHELKDTHFSIYPGFWLQNQTNPTCRWINKVDIPEVNMILGDDSFFNFFHWKNPEDIIKRLSKLYVVPRMGNMEQRDRQVSLFKRVNPHLQIIFLNEHPYQEISSTHLRIQK